MSTDDLKHNFEIARHKVAKHVIKKPRMDFHTLNFMVLLPMMSISVIPQMFVEEFTDDQTTDTTVQVEQQFQQRLSEMTIATDNNVAKGFIEDVLLAEELSEEQAEDLLQDLQSNVNDIDTIAGYEIGNIGDLRECRADNDTASAIALCTVEQEKDDNIVQTMDVSLTLLALLMMIGRGIGHGLRSSSSVQRWGKKEPRDPQFKH